jgi:hypothetical protein
LRGERKSAWVGEVNENISMAGASTEFVYIFLFVKLKVFLVAVATHINFRKRISTGEMNTTEDKGEYYSL